MQHLQLSDDLIPYCWLDLKVDQLHEEKQKRTILQEKRLKSITLNKKSTTEIEEHFAYFFFISMFYIHADVYNVVILSL